MNIVVDAAVKEDFLTFAKVMATFAWCVGWVFVGIYIGSQPSNEDQNYKEFAIECIQSGGQWIQATSESFVCVSPAEKSK